MIQHEVERNIYMQINTQEYKTKPPRRYLYLPGFETGRAKVESEKSLLYSPLKVLLAPHKIEARLRVHIALDM